MSDLDTSAIERFIALVKYTAQAHAGQPTGNIMVRVPLFEATTITSEIAAVMTRLATLQHNDDTHLSATADGGSLR
jgi:hypothetical protein